MKEKLGLSPITATKNTPTLNLQSVLKPLFVLLVTAGCASTLPAERHAIYHFPSEAVFVEQPTGENTGRPMKALGWVRSKAHFPTLEQRTHDSALCRNYYHKAAGQLLKEARKVGADAVIQVRSIVFLFSGQTQEFPTPECSDDGAEGEILLRGIAVQYLPWPSPTPVPSPKPKP